MGTMGTMGTMGPMKTMVLLGLMGLVVACTSEPVVPEEPEMPEEEVEMPIGASISALPLGDGGVSHDGTRAWVPPTPYVLYDDLYAGSHFTLMTNRTIDAFFAKETASGGLPNPLHGKLRYSSSKNVWTFSLPSSSGVKPEDIPAGDYYAYGYIPRDAASDATLTTLDPFDPELTFADGAVITIQGLKSVGNDACICIGAKDGFSKDYDGKYNNEEGGDPAAYDDGTDSRYDRLKAGDFKFNLKTKVNPEDKVENYLYLLFDHLCSAVRFNMKVHPEYNKLRTIKLKELYLRTSSDDDFTEKTDVTVTLVANTTGSNPITDVTYTPTGVEDPGGVTWQTPEDHPEGIALTTSYQGFMGHFMPYGVTKLILTSTYDVYDKNPVKNPDGTDKLDDKGNKIYNLVRKDCKAMNTLVLKNIIELFKQTERGKLYTINLTIKPTYLYVMSDPDADLEIVVD